MVRNREARLKGYEEKLGALREELQKVEGEPDNAKDKQFRIKKLNTEIAALERIIRNTDNDIKNIKTEISV